MNTTMSRGLTRLVAGPVVAAGLIGGALGLAAVANASTAQGATAAHVHPPSAGVTITPTGTDTAAKEQPGDGKYRPGTRPDIPGGYGGSPTPRGTYTAAVKEQAGDGTYQPGAKPSIPGGIPTGGWTSAYHGGSPTGAQPREGGTDGSGGSTAGPGGIIYLRTVING
jgi:hypothetical protein